MTNSTIKYYEENAQDFFEGTVNVQMDELYHQFLPLIPEGGHILDAGCGSGRDALYFKNKGYKVSAFDASAQLAEKASSLLGQAVLNMTFDEVDQVNEFDGIWACASLLHVDFDDLPEVLNKLINSLTSTGILYASFKYGHEISRIKDQRVFTDMSEERLEELIKVLNKPVNYSIWISKDQRSDREELWLNILISVTEDSQLS